MDDEEEGLDYDDGDGDGMTIEGVGRMTVGVDTVVAAGPVVVAAMVADSVAVDAGSSWSPVDANVVAKTRLMASVCCSVGRGKWFISIYPKYILKFINFKWY